MSKCVDHYVLLPDGTLGKKQALPDVLLSTSNDRHSLLVDDIAGSVGHLNSFC